MDVLTTCPGRLSPDPAEFTRHEQGRFAGHWRRETTGLDAVGRRIVVEHFHREACDAPPVVAAVPAYSGVVAGLPGQPTVDEYHAELRRRARRRGPVG